MVYLLLNALWVWRSGSRLRGQIEAIRRSGGPVTLRDLTADSIAPEQNAATYLQRARNDLKAASRELDDLYCSDTYENGRLTEEQLRKVESVFAVYPNLLAQLESAAAAGTYRPMVDDRATSSVGKFIEATLPETEVLRDAARLLQARAYWQLAHGDRDGALASSITLLRLSRRFDCSMVDYLTGIACQGISGSLASRVLYDGPVSDATHDLLEHEWQLAEQANVDGFREALKSERAYGITGFAHDIPGRNIWFFRAFWDGQQSAHLDALGRMIDVADRPYRETQKEFSRIHQGIPSLYTLTKLIIPAVLASHEASTRSVALARALRVLNALQRRSDPEALPKADLSDLGLPEKATLDPYSGKPLIVKRTPRGWLVYSVGSNLKDDGGAIEQQFEDVGVKPPEPAESPAKQ